MQYRKFRPAAAVLVAAALAGLFAGPAGCAPQGGAHARSYTAPYEPSAAHAATAGRVRIAERYRRDHDADDVARTDAEDLRRAAAVNPWTDTDQDPRSTFALDVDTASFAHARQSLSQNLLPPAETVRSEEFVNAFRYEDPIDPRQAFTVNAELAPTPFARGAHLLRISLRARPVADEDRKPANLTFVVDVSGSMQPANRLPLVKQALAGLVERLAPDDQVAIVIFSSSAECILPLTPVSRWRLIERAIDSLAVAGATSIEDGLTLGYAVAGDNFDRTRINRVILCTDGEANVGNTSPNGILAAVAREKARGITLSTVGFGLRDYNDRMLETLADKGNGNAAHVDSLEEASRVFGDNLTAMLQIVAKDAKIQVEFNPDLVQEYRLIGYEDRTVADRDFRNNRVDAGEVGAGHAVTALYEIALREIPRTRVSRRRERSTSGDADVSGLLRPRASLDAAVDALLSDDLPAARAARDGNQPSRNRANPTYSDATGSVGLPPVDAADAAPGPGTLCTLRLRYNLPDSPAGNTLPDGREPVLEQTFDITSAALVKILSRTTADFRLSMAAAQLAELLKNSPYAARRDIDAVLALADSVAADRPDDPQIQDLLDMAEKVRTLLPPPRLSRR